MARPNDSIKNKLRKNSAGRLDMKLRRDDSAKSSRSPNSIEKSRIPILHSHSSDISSFLSESNRSAYKKIASDVFEGDAFKVRPVWSCIVCCVSPLM